MGLRAATNTKLNERDDLEGCLIVVQAHDIGEAPSSLPGAKAGDMYTYITATVAVLDGDVSPKVVEMIGHNELPIVIEDFRLTASAIIRSLTPKVGKYDEDGTPKLLAARISRYRNKFRNDNSVLLDEPSDDDMTLAGRFVESELGKSTFPERDPFADGRAGKAFS